MCHTPGTENAALQGSGAGFARNTVILYFNIFGKSPKKRRSAPLKISVPNRDPVRYTPLSHKNTCGTCLLGSARVPVPLRFSDVFWSEIACFGQYMEIHTIFKLLVAFSLLSLRSILYRFQPHVRASYRQCESSSIGSSTGSCIESIRKRSTISAARSPRQAGTRLQQGETATTQDTAAESEHRQRHCQSWSRCRGFGLVGPLTLQFLQAHDT